MVYVKTEVNPADILTKSLDVKKFKVLSDIILGHLLLEGVEAEADGYEIGYNRN